MTKIIFRLLTVFVIIVSAALIVLSALTGVNIYEKYGKEIMICIVLFCGVVIAFYTSLALLGIS